MASKLINIRWIRTSSKPYWKIMYRIVSYPVFYEDKNAPLVFRGIQNFFPRKAVYNTMR